MADNNPWRLLPPFPPFVLPDDRDAVEAFNVRASAEHAVHLELLPEPFLGNPEAPVVLLNLNPGFSDADHAAHQEPSFASASTDNLLHRRAQFPFFLLDPSIPSPGQHWWKQKLRRLIERTSLLAVATNVFVIEIHGYHSRRFSSRLALSSQRYTRQLVLNAVRRNATVIVMRGWRWWSELVPELSQNSVAFLRNVQNPTISPSNCPDIFDTVVTRIRNGA